MPGLGALLGGLPVVGPLANFLRNWDYRPTTTWFSDFITVNWNGKDAELEQKVLGDVGSYGLQLSRILDALELLLADKKLGELTPSQQRTVVRLQDLAAQARESVERHRTGPQAPGQ